LSLSKYLPLTHHHSHFLAATCISQLFKAAPFLQLGCF